MYGIQVWALSLHQMTPGRGGCATVTQVPAVSDTVKTGRFPIGQTVEVQPTTLLEDSGTGSVSYIG